MHLEELKDLIRQEIVSMKEAEKSDIEKLDTKLPANIERFLDRAVGAIKDAKLNRRRQIAALARIIDALGLDKGEVTRYIAKIKKAV
jgi:hypothetical protein|tara:strand:- start:167 stop:427 length:261 start_codon:yes stop_codon:yes gene_type:complete